MTVREVRERLVALEAAGYGERPFGGWDVDVGGDEYFEVSEISVGDVTYQQADGCWTEGALVYGLR